MHRNKKLRSLPINRIIPNLVTLTALAIGVSSIRFSLVEKWEYALFSLVFAAILDGIDGRIARLLRGTSKFGAELDSLADFSSFGIVTGLVVYLYAFSHYGLIGWVACLFYIICMGMRLARFNVFLQGDAEVAPKSFFLGVSAPIGSLLALVPIMIDFQFESKNIIPAPLYALYITVVAFSLISRVPTFSFKKGAIAPQYTWLVFVLLGISIVSFVTVPWLTLLVLLAIFLITIPFSYKKYASERNQEIKDA